MRSHTNMLQMQMRDDLCNIDSRFFLPLEQSRTALLGCRLAAWRLREIARWHLRVVQC